jgi:Esterase-like activity of phytase
LSRHALIATALAAGVTIALAGCTTAPEVPPDVPERGQRFDRAATFPVYLNTSAAEHTAAEIAVATPDERTVVYSDSPGERIGFIDIADLSRPSPAGVLAMPGEPTSVEVLGDLVLVAVNTSESKANPSGRLIVVDGRTRAIVAEHELGGQPDSIDVSPDGRYAAIAIENERDEEVAGGAVPQAPGGYLSIVDLDSAPADWRVRKVDLAGIADIAPEDPETEYVSINDANRVAVTLQENSHIVVVDLPSGSVVTDFSAGEGTAQGVDTTTDGFIRADGTVTASREPDAVGWLDERYIATADEGDLNGGSRTWTIFDTQDGSVVYSSDAELEQLAIRNGQYPEDRASEHGVEPEGLAIADYDGQRYVFVGTERANFVAVYRVDDPHRPELVQALPTGVGPEGLLPLPQRGGFVVSAEEDSAEDNVRSSVSTYRLTDTDVAEALANNATYPSIVSASDPPIGFGALSGLSSIPGDGAHAVTVTDNAYTPTRILTVDVSARPATITDELTITKAGAPVGYDIEGIAARRGGGYWLAVEGDPKENLANLLLDVDAGGAVVAEIPLPEQVAAGATANGFEGVTTIGEGPDEQVWLAVQREWADDPKGLTKLARYTPATGTWGFVHYPFDAAPPGATMGLSELTALDADTMLVLERDDRRGLDATIKKITRVEIANVTPAPAGSPLPVLAKSPVSDLIPTLQAGGGAVSDKPEGVAVIDGEIVVAVDNDGLDDAPGESMLLHLGPTPTD